MTWRSPGNDPTTSARPALLSAYDVVAMVEGQAVSPRGSRFVRSGCFWAWATVGVVGALGCVSLGPIAVAPAFICAVLLSRQPVARRSAAGLLAGGGLVCLLVAYLQRAGPGTTCWHTATAVGCDQHLDPLPWALVGVVLLVGALITRPRQSH